jgi:hypothetical protein
MSEQQPRPSPQEPRTLEMRIAAIEDRLAQLTVTEEEMRAYQKVAALMTGRPAAAGPATTSGPGPSIPAVVDPHPGLFLFPADPRIGFPTVPVLNIFWPWGWTRLQS